MIRNILIGSFIGVVIVFFIGFKFGVHYEISKSTKSALEAYQERLEIDKNVENLSIYDMCIALGGMRDKCDAMRWMDKATEGK